MALFFIVPVASTRDLVAEAFNAGTDAVTRAFIPPKPAKVKPALVDSNTMAALNRFIMRNLAAGNVVQFRNRKTGVVKVIDSWNPRADGELLTSLSTGKSDYVNPYYADYDVVALRA
jgi:hypothetical protein